MDAHVTGLTSGARRDLRSAIVVRTTAGPIKLVRFIMNLLPPASHMML